jgi:hypothetical protein
VRENAPNPSFTSGDIAPADLVSARGVYVTLEAVSVATVHAFFTLDHSTMGAIGHISV